jgi:photosystem I P700 chlorophyll a apoprotein A2
LPITTLAIAVLFIVAGHMYRTNFGIGHDMKEIMDAHNPPTGTPFGGWIGEGHKGMYDTYNNSLHFQLGWHLACLGVVTSLVAQHMYSLPSYAFIAKDYTTQAALYTHHQYIAGFLMVGAFAHGAIFLIRDYDPKANENNVLYADAGAQGSVDFPLELGVTLPGLPHPGTVRPQ